MIEMKLKTWHSSFSSFALIKTSLVLTLFFSPYSSVSGGRSEARTTIRRDASKVDNRQKGFVSEKQHQLSQKVSSSSFHNKNQRLRRLKREDTFNRGKISKVSLENFTSTHFHSVSQITRKRKMQNSSTKSEFIQNCASQMLAPSTMDDSKISQVEFTNFLLQLCISSELCTPDATLDFNSLSIFIQLNFIWFICPTKNQICVDEIYDQGDEFGLIIDGDNSEEIEQRVYDMCANMSALTTSYYIGTNAPTIGPEATLSFSPTQSPSVKPSHQSIRPTTPTKTSIPSSTPTYKLSLEPSSSIPSNPTNNTSLAPTERSSLRPSSSLKTNTPTTSPTIESRHEPNVRPSALPTIRSNKNPSQGPTRSISSKLTTAPSMSPSSFGSSSPIKSASGSPTFEVVPAGDKLTLSPTVFGVLNVEPVVDDNSNPPEILNDGSIAGIVLGAAFIVLGSCFMVRRLNSKNKQEKYELHSKSSSDHSNEPIRSPSSTDKSTPFQSPNDDENESRSRPVLDYNFAENSTIEDGSPFFQFDPTNGVGEEIAVEGCHELPRREISFSSDEKLTSTRDQDISFEELDAALDIGDWSAVARIAGEISSRENLSALSSMYSDELSESTISVPSPPRRRRRTLLNEKNKRRASRIDNLIDEGDWNAVGATASLFNSEAERSSSSWSTESKSKSATSIKSQTASSPRSFFDFIAWRKPWQSLSGSSSEGQSEPQGLSQSNAVANSANVGSIARSGSYPSSSSETASNTDGSLDSFPIQNIDDAEIQTSDESSLSTQSAQFSSTNSWHPTSPGFGDIVPLTGFSGNGDNVTSAGILGGFECSSSESDGFGDEKPLMQSDDLQSRNRSPLKNSKSKRTWKSRVFFRKSKNDGEHEKKAAELALQEDSSVSSWSHGTSDDEVMVSPYAGHVRLSENETLGGIQQEFGIAAAAAELPGSDDEHDSSDEDDFMSSGSEGGDSSSAISLRDELDRAIESGDWAAVEKQATLMLDIDTSEASTPSRKSIGSNSSYILGISSTYSDSNKDWSSRDQSSTVSSINDERIATLERLIEADDWQGILTAARVYGDESTLSSSRQSTSIYLDASENTMTTNEYYDARSLSSSTNEALAQSMLWDSIARSTAKKLNFQGISSSSEDDKKPRARK